MIGIGVNSAASVGDVKAADAWGDRGALPFCGLSCESDVRGADNTSSDGDFKLLTSVGGLLLSTDAFPTVTPIFDQSLNKRDTW